MPDRAIYQRMYEREKSARKRAEELLESMSMELYHAYTRLKNSSEELFTIFRSVTDGIVTFSADGKIETMNPAFERIFGYNKAYLTGRYIQSLLAVEESKRVEKEKFWVGLCTEVQPKFSTSGVNSKGQRFDMELSASKATQGGREFFVWVVRNTQQLKNVERKAAVSQRMEAIGQLAAGISHEINTPIQYVRENAKFLRDACEAMNTVFSGLHACVDDEGMSMPEFRREYQRLMESSQFELFRTEVPNAIQESLHGSDRVVSIVQAIREFAHPGTAEKSPYDLNHFIASAITVSTNHWSSVSDIQTKLAHDLPTIVCHAAEINQVILNLLVNACDAIGEKSFEGSEKGTITIRTWRDGKFVKLSVSDTGVGIKPEDLERIFALFFTTKPVGKGTGQGLSIVHSIVVEHHGGTIDVSSEPGEGATFVISLPIGS
jgi:two-component system, NtrC family, sensor kinase